MMSETFYRGLVKRVAWWLLGVNLILIGCEQEVQKKTTPLNLNVDVCLNKLNFSQLEQSCAQGVGAVPRGCFMIEGSGSQVSSIPVLWSDAQLSVTEESTGELVTAISELSEQPTKGALVFFAEGAEFDCSSQRLEGECEEGCVVKTRFLLKETSLEYAEIVPGIDEGESCEWLRAEPPIERCDGIDNDCDGTADEGYALGGECSNGGVGVCRLEGITACDEGGQARCMYENEPVEPSDERCDGADNDCDGMVDEEFPEEGARCEPALGEELTPVSSIYECRAGELACPVEERCDEIDNDLDGEVDEGFEVDEPCMPNQDGCNSMTGRIQCVTLELINQRLGEELGEAVCVADRVTVEVEDDTNCDGLDNDCDGFTDESFLEEVVSCGVGDCLNEGGRRRCVDGQVVIECTPLDNVSLDNNCDGRDNDCDTLTDEGFVSYLYPCEGEIFSGECARAARVYCVNNVESQTCPLAVVPPEDEDLRCDGLDEDCDGLVDESYLRRTITCGRGACENQVTSSCTRGVELQSCVPYEPLEGEQDKDCDGVDDDCDGRVDEGYLPTTLTCFSGICTQPFNKQCVVTDEGSVEVGECPLNSLIQPQREVCDGLDNDCDGEIDEGSDLELSETVCGFGGCVNTGEELCVGGVIIDNCVPYEPGEGVVDDCNGEDDDCDGKVDEAFVSAEVNCEGICEVVGVTTCVEGELSNTCSDVVNNDDPEEVCDGIDQNCNGEADENYVELATSCGVGQCASTGVRFCQLGFEGDSCQPKAPTADVSCDGFDQDCDGKVDEAYPVSAVLCGQGACLNSGIRTCVEGEEVTSCTPLESGPDENCNSIDDDCDGFVDEGYAVTSVSCGVGVCERQGAQVCTAAGVQINCTPGLGTGPDNNCNNVDDDCDGLIDESYLGVEITCGLGVCENQVRSTCVNGLVQTSCEPLNVASADGSCNQVDEDCDGRLDEGFVGQVEQCGPGSCEPTAVKLCTTTGIISTCSYQDSPTDQTCNGVDEDCDGLVDEDYVVQMTMERCGVGACEASARVECLNGSVQVVCEPGSPQQTLDDDCDGNDEDCDGLFDEDYELMVTCGVGVCERTVTVGCNSNCTEGEPGQELCGDVLDNDCDGTVDEGFEEFDAPCTVGVGLCERTGKLRCKPQDRTAPLECSVTPGTPVVESCDGADNDCDGIVDEDFLSTVTCLVDDPALENTSCKLGHLECIGGAPSCVSNIAPNELPEDYCTDIDEDCDPSTPARVPGNNETVDGVVFEGGTYNGVKLKGKCGDDLEDEGKRCEWKCLGGVTFDCDRRGHDCELDPPSE